MITTDSLTERNRAIVERLYACAQSGDLASIAGLLADDIVVDEPMSCPTGRSTGVTLHYTIADGDRVAACLGIPDTTTGGRPTSSSSPHCATVGSSR